MIPGKTTERTQKVNTNSDIGIYLVERSKYFRWVIFLILPFLLGSCEAVAGIFKAGMGFGVFLVVAVIIAIVVLFMRMGRNKNS